MSAVMKEIKDTDSIERSVVIRAARDKVWLALTNAEKFGAWFGVKLEGQAFTPGQRTRGQMTISGHEDAFFDVVVERMEPHDHFSFRWHPYAADKSFDYAGEEPTLVTFTLQDEPDQATLVTVVESGFDRLPPQRRLEAFPAHTGGWEAQLKNLERHVSG
ncbi:MAG: SRPBCC family protein [Pseudomonadota bacterium]